MTDALCGEFFVGSIPIHSDYWVYNGTCWVPLHCKFLSVACDIIIKVMFLASTQVKWGPYPYIAPTWHGVEVTRLTVSQISGVQFPLSGPWDYSSVGRSNRLRKTHHLAKRLLSEGVKQHRCERCLLIEWQGVQIPLELDHIDGNNRNHTLTNLRFLCPNCHALTPTWRGRNKVV